MQDTIAKYGHLLRAVCERPWAIAEEALHELVASLSLAAAGQIGRDELEQMLAVRSPGAVNGSRNAAVAVIPIRGVISQGQGLLGMLLGGTSVDQITAEFKAALADRQVDAVVFDVNSPGGTIDGVEELASLIRSSRGRKPIVAVANPRAESAAFWIASQADQLTVTPSGSLGSIGIFTVHEDVSAMAERLGIKTTLISYGKFKTEGNPWEPLSDEARAAMQSRVDHYGQMFERAVARGRKTDVERVRAEFGQGRSITAPDAVRLGMADREETLTQAINRVGQALLAAPSTPFAAISSAATQDEPPADDGADLGDPETEPQAAARMRSWNSRRNRLALALAEIN